MNWKFFLRMAQGYAETAGEWYVNKDTNNEGMDDLTGRALLVVSSLISAILSGDAEKIKSAINDAPETV